jgi:glycosyltransferase involved in cell wall biosynthesis
MSNSSISVAMATFNGARYLGEQLTSLATQTQKPLELIVCDDGSTDETMAILQSFSQLAPFAIKIFQNTERLGYQQNFIKAASLCKGSLIAFCDQDDIWNDDKLSIVSRYFQRSEDLLVAHDYSVFFEDGRQPIRSYFRQLARSGLSPAINLKGCSLTFRRRLIELVGWPPIQSDWSHDMWVCFVTLVLQKRGYIRQSLIQHRIHGNNTSGWVPSEAKLQRLLRRFPFPPFTSTSDLDAFIAQFVIPEHVTLYLDAIERCRLAITNDQYQRALSSLGKRRAICEFRISAIYLYPIRRTLLATALFLGRAYRDGDGILGLVHDILGRRSSMR